jgi:hypothetical protein
MKRHGNTQPKAQEVTLEEDPLSKLISNAREALGKEQSRSDENDDEAG